MEKGVLTFGTKRRLSNEMLPLAGKMVDGNEIFKVKRRFDKSQQVLLEQSVYSTLWKTISKAIKYIRWSGNLGYYSQQSAEKTLTNEGDSLWAIKFVSNTKLQSISYQCLPDQNPTFVFEVEEMGAKELKEIEEGKLFGTFDEDEPMEFEVMDFSGEKSYQVQPKFLFQSHLQEPDDRLVREDPYFENLMELSAALREQIKTQKPQHTERRSAVTLKKSNGKNKRYSLEYSMEKGKARFVCKLNKAVDEEIHSGIHNTDPLSALFSEAFDILGSTDSESLAKPIKMMEIENENIRAVLKSNLNSDIMKKISQELSQFKNEQ